MTATDALDAGHAAFAARGWRAAFSHFSLAQTAATLDAADTDLLAQSAYLSGDPSWREAWELEHQMLVDAREHARAARCAFWLGFGYMNAGEMAQAGGWLARGQRLVDELREECVEQGYLMLPPAIEICDADPAGALAPFTRAAEIGERFHDADLTAIARQCMGHALIGLGETARGMALFDEVLLMVRAGVLSPIPSGDVYCGAIEACQRTFDVRRMREWSAALASWCEGQPDLVPYRGQCLAYVSCVAQTHGDWAAAMDDAQRACTRLTDPFVHPAVGAAYYQRAELLRLRGAFAAAEESYRLAGEHGRDPQPGLALLRLSRGQGDTAAATARRMLQEAHELLARSALLPACVDIFLAAGDIVEARRLADELLVVAGRIGSRFILAAASRSSGAVLLAAGTAAEALAPLRRACSELLALEAPYETAVTRVLIGQACGALGDGDSRELEWQAARRCFEQLGAAPDLRRLDALSNAIPAAPNGLTARELDILRLVARGKTNRKIGDELVISEKTVARHIANIFNKIDVSSRSAATAFAYDHGLVQGPA